jgi:hypothetical protein
VANLADVSTDTCFQPLGLAVPIRGTGRLKTELATQGSDLVQLTDNLTGILKVDAEDGVVSVDFAHLVTGTASLNGEGWSHDSVTAFDQLDADCHQSLSMRTPQGNISGAGGVDLTTQNARLEPHCGEPHPPGEGLTTHTGGDAQRLHSRIAVAADDPQSGSPDPWRGWLANEPGGTAGLATMTLAGDVSAEQ